MLPRSKAQQTALRYTQVHNLNSTHEGKRMKIRLRKINKTERDEFLNKYYIMVVHGKGGNPSPTVMEVKKENGKWTEIEIVEPYFTDEKMYQKAIPNSVKHGTL